MKITKADHDDLNEILKLQYLAYQSEAALFGTNDIPPLKQTLEEITDEYKNGVILKMITDAGVIIGSVRAKEENGTVYISKLMVHPDHRLKGYGSKLLQAIEASFPLKRYELFTSTRSVDNIKLYKKHGYVEFEEKPVNGDLVFVYMEKVPEIWDLYDKDGNKTGETFVRGHGNYKDIPDGLYHLVVDILVVHKDGTYLLMKRSEFKDVYPGYWEASAGGSVVKGEDPITAAKREMFEETGLKADSLELINITIKDSSRSIFYSYLAKVDCDKESIVLQDGETTDYKWVDKEGFLAYVDSDEAIASHNKRNEKYINTLRM